MEQQNSVDWAAWRGEKWSAKLAGMEAMFAPVDQPLIRALALERPCRIADIGCGGGGTSFEILRQAPVQSIVHGFDISADMIKAAHHRISPGASQLAFEVMDVATCGPLEKGYDRLVSRFGIMFFEDPVAAFGNLSHWLAPGGRFAFAVWGELRDNPWMATVRDVVAKYVQIAPLEPGAPGPFRYANGEKLLGILTQAGFKEIMINDWRDVLPIGGGLPPAEAARFALASFSTFHETLSQAGVDVFGAVEKDLTSLFSSHVRDAAVWMQAHVKIVTGRKLSA